MDHKNEAVHDFLVWSEENFGEGTAATIRNYDGRLKYGLFAKYVKDHKELRVRWNLNTDGFMNEADRDYYRLFSFYRRAIAMYITECPTLGVLEPPISTAVAVCSDDPKKKHANKRSRIGAQYHSSKRRIVVDYKRRRRHGAGRSGICCCTGTTL